MKKLYIAPEIENFSLDTDVLNSASTMGTYVEDIWGESDQVL